mmetsp:Transcript_10311/g.22431  ORF Transcript_10311/g.22431 Transcript_10311/m.22431 type:complete len:407 (+) Transcript_10311:41-1261(+)
MFLADTQLDKTMLLAVTHSACAAHACVCRSSWPCEMPKWFPSSAAQHAGDPGRERMRISKRRPQSQHSSHGVPEGTYCWVSVEIHLHLVPTQQICVENEASFGNVWPSTGGALTTGSHVGVARSRKIGPEGADCAGKCKLLVVKIRSITMTPAALIVAECTLILHRAALLPFGKSPLSAAGARLHEVRLPHDEGDLILVDTAKIVKVVVGHCRARRVRLVPVVEAVDIGTTGDGLVESGGTSACGTQHLIRLDAPKALGVDNAPTMLVVGRIKLKRACCVLQADHLKNLGFILSYAHVLQVAIGRVIWLQVATLCVLLREEEKAVIGLGAKDDRGIVDETLREHFLRVLGEGDTVYNRSPSWNSAGEISDVRVWHRAQACLRSVSAANPLCCQLCRRYSRGPRPGA